MDPRIPREGSRTSPGGSNTPHSGPNPGVDRSAVIDVPYTEVEVGECGATPTEEPGGPEGGA